MALAYEAAAHYRYRRSSTAAWTSSRWAGRVRQRLEVLVIQAIRAAKPGCEIEITTIEWR